MPKSKQQKTEDLEKIKAQVASAKSIVFTDYKGMKMIDLQELRGALKKKGGKYDVTKTTLLQKAFDNEKVREIVGKASLAVAYSNTDEVSAPKEIKLFSKKNPNIKILGGYYEGGFLTAEEMLKLADIPSKEELIAKLLGTLRSPIIKTVQILGGQTPKLVRTLQAIVDKG